MRASGQHSACMEQLSLENELGAKWWPQHSLANADLRTSTKAAVAKTVKAIRPNQKQITSCLPLAALSPGP